MPYASSCASWCALMLEVLLWHQGSPLEMRLESECPGLGNLPALTRWIQSSTRHSGQIFETSQILMTLCNLLMLLQDPRAPKEHIIDIIWFLSKKLSFWKVSTPLLKGWVMLHCVFLLCFTYDIDIWHIYMLYLSLQKGCTATCRTLWRAVKQQNLAAR